MQVNLDETVKTLTFNQRVTGSIPVAPTNFFKGLGHNGLSLFFPGKRQVSTRGRYALLAQGVGGTLLTRGGKPKWAT